MRSVLILALLVGVNGCFTPDVSNHMCSSQKRGCPAGQVCDEARGVCVAEGSKLDAARDGPAAEAGLDLVPDRAAVDTAAADIGGDQPAPDSQTVAPLVDDTFAHFSQGSLSEPGVKIYVSEKGNVQLVDRLDLNSDGRLDLVISNHQKGSSYLTNSYVYHGTASGFAKQVELPTQGTQGNAIADLDADGSPDILFTSFHNGVKFTSTAFVYWGSPSGYTAAKKIGLPTTGGSQSELADLNMDGYLDLVLSNNHNGSSWSLNSYIYWGGKAGFAAASKADLPTSGATGVAIADINKDGYPDVVFANHGWYAKPQQSSYIYWSSKGIFSPANRTELPTVMPTGVAIADLDGNGYLDVVFSNLHLKSNYKINSYVYLNNDGQFKAKKLVELPTVGPQGVSIADLDADKKLDIVFSNNTDGATTSVNSYVYWGDAGHSFGTKKELPSHDARGNLVADFNGDSKLDVVFFGSKCQYYKGPISQKSADTCASLTPAPLDAHKSTTADPGSVYDRKPVQTFTSRALDANLSPASCSLKVTARVPLKTKLRLMVRSATSAAGLAKASWYGPTSTTDHYEQPNAGISNPTVNSTKIFTLNKAHAGQRYLQYRATLSHDFGNTPVLDRVEISCK